LKQTEKEQKIDGGAYQERLKEQYMKIIGGNDVFNWATKPVEEVLAEPEEDPIQRLLQSNTSIF
jgi:hypothetical protein